MVANGVSEVTYKGKELDSYDPSSLNELQYVPPRTRQQDRGPQDAEPLPYWDNSSPFVLNLIGEPALTREMVKTDWLHSLSLTAIMHRSVLKYHRSLCPPSTSTSPSTRTSSPQNPTTNIFSLK
ncbi:hypothetical protein PSPO01_14141 [Paraphaeosphaeria sporulosa]